MKNNEKLLYAIGEADEKNIPEVSGKGKKAKTISWTTRLGAVAAAAVIAVTAVGILKNISKAPSVEPHPNAITVYGNVQGYVPNSDDLQPLTLRFLSGGMGFESYKFDFEDDLNDYMAQTNNPWTQDMEFETMPVFKNKVYEGWSSQGGFFIYLPEEEMKDMAESVASILNKEIVSVNSAQDMFIQRGDSGDGYPSQEQFEKAEMKTYKVSAECSDGTEIQIYGDGGIRIEFDPAVSLPDGYSFEDGEEKQKTLEYLANEYGNLLQYRFPAYYNDSEYSYVYDAGDSKLQSILNYSLANTRFCLNEEGGLWIIYMDNHFCSSEYVGDYPTISYSEAKELLKEGKYVTSVSSDLISEINDETIAAGELIYRSGSGQDEYFMPYYRFYVQLEDGENHYGALYVPAVSGEYLSGVTAWDGSFN